MSTEIQHETEVEYQSDLDALVSETERRRGIRDRAAELIGCKSPSLFDLLRKQWPVKGTPLTDLELFQAVSLIARYELDPLIKEIHCSRDSRGRILVIVGIDGWIKILHRTEGYDGHEQSIEWGDDGQLVSVTTTVYSKLRSHPITYVAYWTEYAKIGGFIKDSMPSHMLRVFSLRHAARQFAPIGGNVVTQEEARYMQSEVPEPVDHSKIHRGTLLATLNGRVGCKSDEDRDAVVAWCLCDPEAGIDRLDADGARRALETLMERTSRENSIPWEEVLSAALVSQSELREQGEEE